MALVRVSEFGELHPLTMKLAYNEEERAAWDADARILGFGSQSKDHPAGAHYIRFILNSRAQGRLMLLDPAAMSLAQMVGQMLGEQAGKVIARMEQNYLEGGSR